eukprot:5117682-Amphidinium_carterae.2
MDSGLSSFCKGVISFCQEGRYCNTAQGANKTARQPDQNASCRMCNRLECNEFGLGLPAASCNVCDRMFTSPSDHCFARRLASIAVAFAWRSARPESHGQATFEQMTV